MSTARNWGSIVAVVLTCTGLSVIAQNAGAAPSGADLVVASVDLN